MNTPEKCLKCGQEMSTHSFTQCVIDQRDQLADEVSRLRRDDWVGGACLHLMAQHGVPIGSPQLLEAKARVEAEIETLRTANAQLADQVKALKAVTEDPHALWTNWLRGSVRLPAGIGDIRQSEERAKRLQEVLARMIDNDGMGRHYRPGNYLDARKEAQALLQEGQPS